MQLLLHFLALIFENILIKSSICRTVKKKLFTNSFSVDIIAKLHDRVIVFLRKFFIIFNFEKDAFAIVTDIGTVNKICNAIAKFKKMTRNLK